MIWSSEQLGRVMVWGALFFGILITDMEVEGDTGYAFFVIMFLFIFGGLFLDSMKRLWKYEEVHYPKQSSSSQKSHNA